MRIDVMHPHQHGAVDDQRTRLRQQPILLGWIESLLGLIDQRIDLRLLAFGTAVA
jgi:hypothetical protein